MKKQKRMFEAIFILFALMLIILPFLVSFNEALTKLVEKFVLYNWIQNKIVPLEVIPVSFFSSLLGVAVASYKNGFIVKGTFLEMTWNCVGWQSLLLFSLTLIAGLRGSDYTTFSKLETLVIGLFGIFWMNIFRLTLIVVIFNYLRPLYAYVYHDYFAAIATVIFLFAFWWFSYKFILEEKEQNFERKELKV